VTLEIGHFGKSGCGRARSRRPAGAVPRTPAAGSALRLEHRPLAGSGPAGGALAL